jgi:hypothetical protein
MNVNNTASMTLNQLEIGNPTTFVLICGIVV